MRGTIRLLVSASLASGLLLSASAALACSADSTHQARLPASRISPRAKLDACTPGSTCAKEEGAADPRKGAVDDRLVRPHPRLDASAGVLG